MLNTWNAYNSFITFTWSRAASFIYCGLRNGYGYRDTVQDIQPFSPRRKAMVFVSPGSKAATVDSAPQPFPL